MRWAGEFVERLTVTAVLRYLAVAHYGRGRGDWSEGEHPPFWKSAVEEESAGRVGPLLATTHKGVVDDETTRAIAAELRRITAAVLAKLYPEAARAQDGDIRARQARGRFRGSDQTD